MVASIFYADMVKFAKGVIIYYVGLAQKYKNLKQKVQFFLRLVAKSFNHVNQPKLQVYFKGAKVAH
jgi:hypothetical protein